MSYEQELDYYQKYVEPALIRQEQRERAEEKKDLERLEANMPQPNEEVAVDRLVQASKLKKVAGGYSE